MRNNTAKSNKAYGMNILSAFHRDRGFYTYKINDKKEEEHPIYKCLKWNKLLSGELLFVARKASISAPGNCSVYKNLKQCNYKNH